MTSKKAAKRKAKHLDIGACSSETISESGDGKTKKRASKKRFSPVMVYASVNSDGIWVIKKEIVEHQNHIPNPSMARLVKEYRIQSFTRNVRRRLLNDVEAGVPIAQIHGSLARERDGLANMPYMEKDMRHVVDKERRLKMEGGDANALVEYFERMQRDNINFFHAHRLDEHGGMKDIVWVDARSRAAYEEFSNVVCFDSTYLTNEYELPFSNFVGVNLHGQSTLFGCALVSHEDSNTFAWVFRQWLLCMKGKAQKVETTHPWCIWLIILGVIQTTSYDPHESLL